MRQDRCRNGLNSWQRVWKTLLQLWRRVLLIGRSPQLKPRTFGKAVEAAALQGIWTVEPLDDPSVAIDNQEKRSRRLAETSNRAKVQVTDLGEVHSASSTERVDDTDLVIGQEEPGVAFSELDVYQR